MAHEDDYRPLSDKEIINLVDENVRTSTGYYDSELSRERKKVIDYYNGILPRPTHEGNSRYVSQDVYDCVESMKAALLKHSQLAIRFRKVCAAKRFRCCPS